MSAIVERITIEIDLHNTTLVDGTLHRTEVQKIDVHASGQANTIDLDGVYVEDVAHALYGRFLVSSIANWSGRMMIDDPQIWLRLADLALALAANVKEREHANH